MKRRHERSMKHLSITRCFIPLTLATLWLAVPTSSFAGTRTVHQMTRPTLQLQSSETDRPKTLSISSPDDNKEEETPGLENYIEVGYQDYFDGTKPDAAWNLATTNFIRQGKTILQQALETVGLTPRDPLRPPQCLGLVLDNDAVLEAERQREARGERINVHPVSRLLYDIGCYCLDNLFEDRPIPRFWFLETIARIPYFSYVSMLHLYESFGWFRAVELRKVHAAEDWNELHHLLIMESLGGNALWSDRFLGYHVALLYYWALVATYLCSPRVAYQFMALLEAHAVDTYGTFLDQNQERLKSLPPPRVATSYYKTGDLYMFDDFQVSRPPGSRRPPCENLYDVFTNICVDEGEHVRTMIACQDYAVMGNKVVSPHLRSLDSNSDIEPEQLRRRKQWQEWSESVNKDGHEQ